MTHTEPQLPDFCSVLRNTTAMYSASLRRICTNVPSLISASMTCLSTSPSGTPDSKTLMPTSSSSASGASAVAFASGTECATSTSEVLQPVTHQKASNSSPIRPMTDSLH